MLEPLGGADERHRRRRGRDGAMHDGAQALRRHRDDDQRGAGDGVLDRRGGTDAVDERDARQIVGVLARLGERRDQRGIAAPQPHVVAEARQVHGERRAPAAGAENGDRVHGDQIASGRSVPARSRVMLAWCLQHDHRGDGGGRFLDEQRLVPRRGADERQRRRQRAERHEPRAPDDGDEDGERRRRGDRGQHREGAARGGDALAAAEAQPDRRDVADDRGDRGERDRAVAGVRPPRQPHRERALGRVGERDEQADGRRRRAQRVGGADVAAADAAQVEVRPAAHDEPRHRDRSEGVGGDDRGASVSIVSARLAAGLFPGAGAASARRWLGQRAPHEIDRAEAGEGLHVGPLARIAVRLHHRRRRPDGPRPGRRCRPAWPRCRRSARRCR